MADKRTLPRQALGALGAAQSVHRVTGKSVLSQLAEMARLIQLPNRISPDEYFSLRVFDDERLDWSAKTEFLGKRAKPYVYRVNDPGWRALANDKLVCLAQLRAFGLPVSRTVAIHPGLRIFPDARRLGSLEDVASFLRGDAPYPLFCKPTEGTLGRGAVALMGYDRTSDDLLVKDGTRLPVSVFLQQAIAMNPGGTIFQELVVPHPALRVICGDRLATVRALVLNGSQGPVLHRAVFRIPTGTNMVDNFKHGLLGNLLASVDPSNGTVRRIIVGTGLALRERDHHPDTGHSLVRLQVPDWDAAVDVCRSAARVMSGMRIQGWDIALSDRGPLLLEVNFLGDLDLYQIAEGRGVADRSWRDFVRPLDGAGVAHA